MIDVEDKINLDIWNEASWTGNAELCDDLRLANERDLMEELQQQELQLNIDRCKEIVNSYESCDRVIIDFIEGVGAVDNYGEIQCETETIGVDL
jgi:hypothetical protein